MADLELLQTELPGLMGDLLGTPCAWRHQPRQMHDRARAQLDLLPIRGLGVDDRVWSDVLDGAGDPEAVEATQHGNREATLQVTVWSPFQGLSKSARYYLERLRTRLRFPTTLERLKALGLALVTIEQIVQLDPPEDGRIASRAAMDVHLAWGDSEADEAIPFIETARVYSEELRDTDGDPLPAGLQVDQTLNLTEP